MAASLLGLCVLVRLTLQHFASGLAARSVSVFLAVLIVVAGSDQVRVNLNFGQINVFIALLIVADLSDVAPRVPRGVMSGVAAAIKLTPLFVVVYYVTVRRYRAATVAAGTFAGVTALAYLAAPRASGTYWLHGHFADPRRVGGIAYISNQSINGVIVRLTGSPNHARVFWIPTAIIAAAVLLWAIRRVHDRRPWLAESIALAAILLLSPVSWIHHWILALPFLVACLRLCTEENKWRLLAWPTGALAAVLWFGAIWHVPNTHNREYHYNTLRFLIGNSDVLLLIATISTVVVATRAADNDRSSPTPDARARTENAGLPHM